MDKVYFCPRHKCFHHNIANNNSTNWFKKIGSYRTKAFGDVKRFECLACGKTFSEQTFKIDYYAKKVLDYEALFHHVVSKSGIRSMSRFFHVTTETIQNRISRLARQAIHLHEACKSQLHLNEDLVADGFESFAVSQYFPDNINILIGKESQFVYQTDYVTIRRKGNMTKKQKKKRAKLEKRFKANPKGVKKSFSNLLDEIVALNENKTIENIKLYTDEKKDYQRAIHEHQEIQGMLVDKSFSHQQISSRVLRDAKNDLFAVNYIDREYRKGLANHVRETMEFTRNVNDGMNRLTLYNAYHNYWKNYRIKEKKDQRYHGEVAGIERSVIEEIKSAFYKVRAFFSHGKLNKLSKKLWFRKYVTPLKNAVEYYPSYATM